jgi:hypothetical protein
MSRGSVVGIPTGDRLNGREVRVRFPAIPEFREYN